MPLLASNQVKQVIGNTQLTLTAEADESFRIKGVRIATPASDFVQFTVDKTTVAEYQAGQEMGNHLFFPLTDSEIKNLMETLIEEGIFRPIPVASGQTFKIVGAHQSTSVVAVIYDRFSPGDVKSSEPNGSDAKEYDFVIYGYNSGTGLLAAGDNQIDICANQSEFYEFPFEKPARNNAETVIHGIGFSDIGGKISAGNGRTNYLKLIRNRETLFDEDKNGTLDDIRFFIYTKEGFRFEGVPKELSITGEDLHKEVKLGSNKYDSMLQLFNQ